MLSEDRIIQMINLAVAALLRIIGLKKAGDYNEALILISLTLEQLVGLPGRMARSLDDERLYYLLTRNDELDVRRLAIIANLFKEEGDILAQLGRTAESRENYTRALKYYLEISTHELPMDAGELALRIEELAQMLGLDRLEADVLWPLFLYYEETGAYARAETALQTMVNRPELRGELQPELIAFYGRLLEQPEAALRAAGLDRETIRKKMAER